VSETPNQPVAFFDLDRTIIDVNSGVLYARSELRHGRISRFQMFQSLVWSALYHFDLVDLDRAFRVALSHYKGLPDAELRDRTTRWFEADVTTRIRPGAVQAIRHHQQAGHPCVVLTNSSSYAAEVACRRFGLDDWLANHFVQDSGGRLTGDYEAPLCYGAGKVVRAQKWADERGYSLQHSYFYTDSRSDLPMLEAVGFPIVVHPDPRLRRIARKRRWPIQMW